MTFIKLSGWTPVVGSTPAPNGPFSFFFEELKQLGVVIEQGVVRMAKLAVDTVEARWLIADSVKASRINADTLCVQGACLNEESLRVIKNGGSSIKN